MPFCPCVSCFITFSFPETSDGGFARYAYNTCLCVCVLYAVCFNQLYNAFVVLYLANGILLMCACYVSTPNALRKSYSLSIIRLLLLTEGMAVFTVCAIFRFSYHLLSWIFRCTGIFLHAAPFLFTRWTSFAFSTLIFFKIFFRNKALYKLKSRLGIPHSPISNLAFSASEPPKFSVFVTWIRWGCLTIVRISSIHTNWIRCGVFKPIWMVYFFHTNEIVWAQLDIFR